MRAYGSVDPRHFIKNAGARPGNRKSGSIRVANKTARAVAKSAVAAEVKGA